MAEQIIGSIVSNMWQIDDNKAGLITGSVAITNASIQVDVTVQDYVSVQASGAWIATSGQSNVSQVTNPWIVLGSQAITNLPASYNGSVYQSTNPWVTLGSTAITNVLTGSVIQGTNPWVTLGSTAVTNVLTGSVIQSTNPWLVQPSGNYFPTVIVDYITGSVANVIECNGNNGLVAIAPGHVSTVNSTNIPLVANGSFVGTAEDVTNYGVIIISTKSDKASATNGLSVQFSVNGSDWDCFDNFTIPAATDKTFSFQTCEQYMRVVYTNGASDQTYFRLQTQLKPYYVKPSSHRIQDSIIDEDDAELVKAVITGKNAAGNFVNFQATTAGNFKVSLEEVESGVVVPVSGTITVSSENVPYDSNEQLTFVAGSPVSSVNAFTGGLIKTLTIKCDEDTYVKLGSYPVTTNDFLVYAGEAVSSNFQAGSISHLAKAAPGSVWVWGGR